MAQINIAYLAKEDDELISFLSEFFSDLDVNFFPYDRSRYDPNRTIPDIVLVNEGDLRDSSLSARNPLELELIHEHRHKIDWEKDIWDAFSRMDFALPFDSFDYEDLLVRRIASLSELEQNAKILIFNSNALDIVYPDAKEQVHRLAKLRYDWAKVLSRTSQSGAVNFTFPVEIIHNPRSFKLLFRDNSNEEAIQSLDVQYLNCNQITTLPYAIHSDIEISIDALKRLYYSDVSVSLLKALGSFDESLIKNLDLENIESIVNIPKESYKLSISINRIEENEACGLAEMLMPFIKESYAKYCELTNSQVWDIDNLAQQIKTRYRNVALIQNQMGNSYGFVLFSDPIHTDYGDLIQISTMGLPPSFSHDTTSNSNLVRKVASDLLFDYVTTILQGREIPTNLIVEAPPLFPSMHNNLRSYGFIPTDPYVSNEIWKSLDGIKARPLRSGIVKHGFDFVQGQDIMYGTHINPGCNVPKMWYILPHVNREFENQAINIGYAAASFALKLIDNLIYSH